MPDPAPSIAANLDRVRDRIHAAAEGAGRSADEITLVAVSKYVGPDTARALVEAGCHDLGESRPQELWNKAEQMSDLDIRWHLVGHLQRNKVRHTLPLVTLVHSVDSLRLLEAIDRVAGELTLTVPILLEVNISGEEAKHGLKPDAVSGVLERANSMTGIRIRGLMAMAGLAGGRDGARRGFANLRELRDRLMAGCPPSVSLNELSMGMSNDFDLAILEGATLVRIGTALFRE